MSIVMKMIVGENSDGSVKGYSKADGFGVLIPSTIGDNRTYFADIVISADKVSVAIEGDVVGTAPSPAITTPAGIVYSLVWDGSSAYAITSAELATWMLGHYYSLFEFTVDGFTAAPKTLNAEEDDQDMPLDDERDTLILEAVRNGASNAELKSRFGLVAKESKELRKSLEE